MFFNRNSFIFNIKNFYISEKIVTFAVLKQQFNNI